MNPLEEIADKYVAALLNDPGQFTSMKALILNALREGQKQELAFVLEIIEEVQREILTAYALPTVAGILRERLATLSPSGALSVDARDGDSVKDQQEPGAQGGPLPSLRDTGAGGDSK
jgi:hypothetical protein